MSRDNLPDGWPPDEGPGRGERDDRPPDYGLRHVEFGGQDYSIVLVHGRVWATGGVLRGRVDVDVLLDLALSLGAAADELRGDGEDDEGDGDLVGAGADR